MHCRFVEKSVIFIAALSAVLLLQNSALAQYQPRPAGGAQTLTPAQAQLIQLLAAGKYDDARQFLQKAIGQAKGSVYESELYYQLAVIEYEEEDFKSALKDLQRVMELEQHKIGADPRRKIFVLKRIGDCYYKLNDPANAVTQYKVALLADKTLPHIDPLLGSLLESIVGALVAEKRHSEAQEYGEQLLQVTASRAGTGRTSDIAAYFWAQLELLNVYRETQNEQSEARLEASAVDLLNRLMSYRAKLEMQNQLPPPEMVRTAFLNEYVQDNRPRSLAEYLWLTAEYRTRTLPLIEWPAASGRPKASILCIHGLGLENRAFTNFGKEMSRRGYSVLAMDVRGFGSWTQVKGEDEASFDQTVEDIGGLIGLIKRRNPPGVPLFLLGESMGGGIALRAGATYPNEFQGIVTSVPSAERFQEKQMSLKVAVNFLKGPGKDFDIRSMVADKATSDPVLHKAWENDPKAKLAMSPIELMKFDAFMRTTVRKCKNIKGTPVLILQGLKDKLVKPEGTFEMFKNVEVSDKSILVIGNAEHLMFETENISPILMDSVSTWMDNHLQPAPMQPATSPH